MSAPSRRETLWVGCLSTEGTMPGGAGGAEQVSGVTTPKSGANPAEHLVCGFVVLGLEDQALEDFKPGLKWCLYPAPRPQRLKSLVQG